MLLPNRNTFRIRNLKMATFTLFVVLAWSVPQKQAFADGGLCDMSKMTLQECNILHREAQEISKEAWKIICAGQEEACRRLGWDYLYEKCKNSQKCNHLSTILRKTLTDCIKEVKECRKLALPVAKRLSILLAIIIPGELDKG